jgi:uncharacterized protein (DUF2132 family)
MTETDNQDPLHGKTLEMILIELVERHGWSGLAEQIPINCFSSDPSIKSSLVFLRRTPWARSKVEALYLDRLPKRRGTPKRRPPRGQPPPRA